MIKSGKNIIKRKENILMSKKVGCIILDFEETIWRERKGIFDKNKTWIE